jgi:murein DD-endopeptidase MepM/ murein hydrolase activator NlpD
VVLGGTAGLPVVAVQPGEVVFRGAVARRIWLVIRRRDGLTVVYGGVNGGVTGGPSLGSRVATGDDLGIADTTLYVGVRLGETPIDPSRVMCLGQSTSSDRRVARLVPADSL